MSEEKYKVCKGCGYTKPILEFRESTIRPGQLKQRAKCCDRQRYSSKKEVQRFDLGPSKVMNRAHVSKNRDGIMLWDDNLVYM